MCGIAGIAVLDSSKTFATGALERALGAMNALQRHRGPDGEGVWAHAQGRVGFAHRRLSIIDLDTGAQPMTDGAGNWV